MCPLRRPAQGTHRHRVFSKWGGVIQTPHFRKKILRLKVARNRVFRRFFFGQSDKKLMEGIFHLQSTAFQAGDVSFQVFLCRGAKLFLHILFSLPPVPFPWSAALGGNAKSFYRGGTLQIENEQIVRKEDQTSAPPNRVQISVAHSGQADDCKIHRLQIVGCRAPTTDTSNKFPISHRRRLRFLS